MRSIRKVLAALRKADELFSLIDEKDRIALGISGGKDSLALLLAMSLYSKFSKKDFVIVPITLDLGFDGFDADPLREYCQSLGLSLHVENCQEVYPILKANTKPGGHIPCSICSRMKKAAINEAAKKYGCNKVAFAHHKDDAIETLFMNMIHGGRVATFEPKMHLDRAGITFIRPLVLAEEKDLASLAKEESLPVVKKTCPADGFTEREWTKRLLASIYQSRPEAVANLSKALYNYQDFGLYFSHIETKENDGSPYSLKPCLSANDALDYEHFAQKNGLKGLVPGCVHVLLLKAHRLMGAISYSSPRHHEIEIRACDALDKNDLKEFLLRFETSLAKKENPLDIQFLGYKNKGVFEQLGYQKVTRNGKNAYRKKIIR